MRWGEVDADTVSPRAPQLGSAERLEARREPFAVRTPFDTQRQLDCAPPGFFQHVQHGTIVFLDQPPGEVHLIVGRHSDEILIVRSVMDAAEAQPVRDRRESLRIDVLDDVRSIEKPKLSKAADSAAVAVSLEDECARKRP